MQQPIQHSIETPGSTPEHIAHDSQLLRTVFAASLLLAVTIIGGFASLMVI